MRKASLRTSVVTGLSVLASLLVCNSSYAEGPVILYQSLPGETRATVNGDQVDVWFHAEIGIIDNAQPDAQTDGIILLRFLLGKSLLLRVVDGTWVGGPDLEAVLLLEGVGKSGSPTGDLFVATISKPADPSEPCRIYDILGTQVNARIVAPTIVRFFGK